MGEIAESMLDGTCCEGCGGFIGNAAGHPRYCSKACEPAGYVSDREQELRDRHRSKSMAGSIASAGARKNARHNRERKERAKLAGKPFECFCGKLCRTAEGLTAHKYAKHSSESW